MIPENIFEKINKIIAISSVILCLIGIIGNNLTAGLCMRKKLRKSPTFIFLSFIAIINIIPLITIVLCPYFLYFYKKVLSEINIDLCKTVMFLTFWSCHSSTYLLVYFKFSILNCSYY